VWGASRRRGGRVRAHAAERRRELERRRRRRVRHSGGEDGKKRRRSLNLPDPNREKFFWLYKTQRNAFLEITPDGVVRTTANRSVYSTYCAAEFPLRLSRLRRSPSALYSAAADVVATTTAAVTSQQQYDVQKLLKKIRQSTDNVIVVHGLGGVLFLQHSVCVFTLATLCYCEYQPWPCVRLSICHKSEFCRNG